VTQPRQQCHRQRRYAEEGGKYARCRIRFLIRQNADSAACPEFAQNLSNTARVESSRLTAEISPPVDQQRFERRRSGWTVEIGDRGVRAHRQVAEFPAADVRRCDHQPLPAGRGCVEQLGAVYLDEMTRDEVARSMPQPGRLGQRLAGLTKASSHQLTTLFGGCRRPAQVEIDLADSAQSRAAQPRDFAEQATEDMISGQRESCQQRHAVSGQREVQTTAPIGSQGGFRQISR